MWQFGKVWAECDSVSYKEFLWTLTHRCNLLYFPVLLKSNLTHDPCLNVLHDWLWFMKGKRCFLKFETISRLQGMFFPSRMLFNFECKKVLFKDFFPILLLCMLEEQMALKHVIVQAGLRAGRVRWRSLIGRTCHRDFDFQLPMTGDSDCSLKSGLVYILDNDLWTKETHSPTAGQNFSLLCPEEMDKEKDYQTFTERVCGQKGGAVKCAH